MNSRADKVKEALKKQEEDKNRPQFSGDYEVLPYVGLEADEPKVLRFVGEPVEFRSKGTDPKIILQSKIVDDKGKLQTIRWSEDKKWLLWRVHDKVMEYKWDENAPNPNDRTKKGAKVFKYDLSHPELFQRVRWNDKPDNPYEKGWYPTKSVLFNALDREDYQWHLDNKSFKLVAKKLTAKKDDPDVLFAEPGIPAGCYKSLLECLAENNVFWEDADIAIKKLDELPWYKVYAAKEAYKIEDYLAKNHIKMSDSALTEEELSWKMYDFDEHPAFQITSYTKILNNLGDFIKKVDVAFNTHFYEELQAFSAKEKEEWAKKRAEQADTEEEVVEKKEEKVEAPRRERPKPPSKATESNDKFAEARKAGWKIDDVKEEEKVFIKSIVGDNIIYVDEAGIEIPETDDSLLPCYECGTLAPTTITSCPKCGVLFSEEE